MGTERLTVVLFTDGWFGDAFRGGAAKPGGVPVCPPSDRGRRSVLLCRDPRQGCLAPGDEQHDSLAAPDQILDRFRPRRNSGYLRRSRRWRVEEGNFVWVPAGR